MAITTTYTQDRELSECIVDLLGINTVDWTDLLKFISENFTPENIFSDSDLSRWASENELYTKSEIFTKFDPEDIYDVKTLEDWAVRHGWTQE